MQTTPMRMSQRELTVPLCHSVVYRPEVQFRTIPTSSYAHMLAGAKR